MAAAVVAAEILREEGFIISDGLDWIVGLEVKRRG